MEIEEPSAVSLSTESAPPPHASSSSSSSSSSLHEIFLQVCSRFPLSWRPVHRLLLFLRRFRSFDPSPAASARLLDVLGKSRHVHLLWSTLLDLSSSAALSPGLLRVAARALGEAREISKIRDLFALNPSLCTAETLNLVVRTLCERRMVDVAIAVASKLRARVAPDADTYALLIAGSCRGGDLAGAAKLWNAAAAAGIEPGADAHDAMILAMLKSNRFEDAAAMLKSMRTRRPRDVGLESYSMVITRLCKRGALPYANMLFGEMLKRGIEADGVTLGALVYGLLAKRKVREAYKVFCAVRDPDISLFHGLIKGLLRIKRANDATQVFREMLERGCEPIMHTYIMLLQGHMGKRGRKGKDPLVNFESVFVGGLVKAGKTLAATKYVERMMNGAVEVPRFDYNKFLYYFSNEEGVVMFEEVGRRMKEVGLVDLADIFLRYGERMATRDRRRRAMNGLL
ncbi:putative pentatricopeptide repeat-containing protein At1g26500 [Ananas comosus]|uniref:Pentatricopeptide repeat-containing protein At1g26500 n=1 Tax=Ananas comosus TaxID=4615 RepID=A0A6P5G5Y6_ANACO|nr:putative pentatricopeptide repeat-containing protein At1g26500 [Ananas comosus]